MKLRKAWITYHPFDFPILSSMFLLLETHPFDIRSFMQSVNQDQKPGFTGAVLFLQAKLTSWSFRLFKLTLVDLMFCEVADLDSLLGEGETGGISVLPILFLPELDEVSKEL